MAFAQEQGVGTAVSSILDGWVNQINFNNFISKGASNGIAIQKHRTEENKTFLLINPHQPLEGIGSIYEVHLCSEEGMNIHGGVWNGAVNVSIGANEYLACMQTTNQLDFVDVFQLQMKTDEQLVYCFDNEWLTLEKFKISVKVKMLGLFNLNIKRTGYWSKYGATFKGPKGFFSVRAGSLMRIDGAERIYRMGKAKTLKEYKSAAEFFPIENFIYADRTDSIYLVNNGLVPCRNGNYEWINTVPGNTSETLWNDFHRIDELVSYTNPAAGYLYNTNNTAFKATQETENLKVDSFPNYLADRYFTQNNRATRLEELLVDFGEKISYEELKKLKFDTQLPRQSQSLTFLNEIKNLTAEEHPTVAKLIESLQGWDGEHHVESKPASIFLLITWYLYKYKSISSFMYKISFEQKVYIDALTFAKKHLNKYFDSDEVMLGDLLRYRRGKVDLPIAGYPDVLAAVTPDLQKDGRFKFVQGDGFMMFVQLDKGGVQIETLNAFGSSNRPDSPHYTDQMLMYLNRTLKKVTLNKDDVMKQAVKIYNPSGN